MQVYICKYLLGSVFKSALVLIVLTRDCYPIILKSGLVNESF